KPRCSSLRSKSTAFGLHPFEVTLRTFRQTSSQGKPVSTTASAQWSNREKPSGELMREIDAFLAARDFLLRHREDPETAYRDFRWPELHSFNWALDYFDRFAEGNDQAGLWIVEETGPGAKLSFDQLRRRSNQVANHLRKLGVRRGERILLMLGNVVP